MTNPRQEQIDKTSSFEVFATYASDNKEALSTVGVIATITALFLNLDSTVYQEGLRDIQILLLLFLVLVLVFLATTTFIWIFKHADSWFGGLVTFTFGLFIWRLIIFITENFRTELNQYLNLILISAMVIVGTTLYRLQTKIEKKFSKYKIRPILYGLTVFGFIYSFDTILKLYLGFASEKPLELSIFVTPFKNLFYWVISLWAIVANFYFEVYKQPSRWLKFFILYSLLVTISFIIIFNIYLEINY